MAISDGGISGEVMSALCGSVAQEPSAPQVEYEVAMRHVEHEACADHDPSHRRLHRSQHLQYMTTSTHRPAPP
jgi:hypothetical protein